MLGFSSSAWAASGDIFCNPGESNCWLYRGQFSSTPAYPSKSSSIRINPAAVPVEKGFGLEGITFKNQWDFSMVKGLGRVGAAISPSNGEESFFGPPGFELSPDYLERKIKQEKYGSQKITLATAFSLLSNKASGLKKAQLNLGVIGKYNRMTNSLWGGVGVNGIAGPLTFGYAISQDEYQIDLSSYGSDLKHNLRYSTETASVGIYLTSLAVDYSYLRIYPEDMDPLQVKLITASLILQRLIFTVANRREESDRPYYDPETKSLITQEVKEDRFVGLQISATSHLMIGCFYNYYLLREFSAGVTLFF